MTTIETAEESIEKIGFSITVSDRKCRRKKIFSFSQFSLSRNLLVNLTAFLCLFSDIFRAARNLGYVPCQVSFCLFRGKTEATLYFLLSEAGNARYHLPPCYPPGWQTLIDPHLPDWLFLYTLFKFGPHMSPVFRTSKVGRRNMVWDSLT